MPNNSGANRSLSSSAEARWPVEHRSGYARRLFGRPDNPAQAPASLSRMVFGRSRRVRLGSFAIQRCILCGLVGLVMGFPATGADTAAEIQDLEGIRQTVISFVRAQLPETRGERNIAVTNMDQRLRLRSCEEGLVAFYPPGARVGKNRTVGVSCSEPKPWTIYVSVRIRYRGNVVVAARTLPRGAIIGDDDTMLEEREIDDGSFGVLTNRYDALGKRTAKTLRSGIPITESALETVPTVVEGQRILLIAQSPHLLVRMFGSALEDGSPGERIRVENSKSKRVVEGIVGEGGVVRIQF